jgi:hypothetical protein
MIKWLDKCFMLRFYYISFFPDIYILIHCEGKCIICRVVLYGCETWSLTLREEHRMRVFENRVLKRIFGPRRDG